MEKLTVKQIRVGLNLTQQELADILGITKETYHLKETKKRKFYFSEILK